MAAIQATIDAAAETAKYLATLSPEAHAKATAYTQGGHWLLLWGTLVAIAVSWIIIRTGVLSRISKGRAGWLAVLAVIPVWFLLDSLLNLPWSVYTGWWRQTQYGLSSQALGGWFEDWGKGLVIGLIMNLILFSVI